MLLKEKRESAWILNVRYYIKRYNGLEFRQTSKPQNRRPLFDVELYRLPHRAEILCLKFVKYYSSWLYVSAQLSISDGYLILYEKYKELNHRDRVYTY
jgi:hypothetical protein